MRNFRARVLAVFFIGFISAISALSQQQPNLENGFKPYGSYDGSNIDSVNLMNGNLVLHIGLPALPQRGGRINQHFMFTVNSKTWKAGAPCVPSFPVPGCGEWDFIGAPVAGTTGTSAGGGGVLLDTGLNLTVFRIYQYDSLGDHATGSYSLQTSDGATHQLYPIPSSQNATTSEYASFEGIAFSGLHLDLTSTDANGIAQTGIVTDRQGNRFQLNGFLGPCRTIRNNGTIGNTSTTTCNQHAWATNITDTNGNLHGVPLRTVGADTLGNTVPYQQSVTSDYTGCVSSLPITGATVYSYPGTNGATNQIKQCIAQIALQTNFGLSGVTEFQNITNPSPGPINVPVTYVMADGTNWTFAYDSYGNVTRVGLPLGGSISYTWSTIPLPPCGDSTTESRAVSSRTISDNNGNSYTSTYAWGAAVNGSMTNVVTDASGNDTAHVFTALDGAQGCQFYETSTVSYQGAQSGGVRLRQVDTAYLFGPVSISTGSGTGTAAFANSIKTTIFPGGKVSQVTRTPDPGLGAGGPSFGNVVKELVYDWGQGQPGALLKETDTLYQWQADTTGNYRSAHLLDEPASVTVKDGAGCTVAQTTYSYDEAAYLTTSGIVTQHGAPPAAVRGNLTSTSHALLVPGASGCPASAGSVTSHTNWYDTGMPYQSTDPLGNTTTFTYDPAYIGAFVTKTCNALNHCVSGAYDFPTGLLTSFTDKNNNVSKYSYDKFARILSASFPDGGLSQFTYPNSTERDRSVTINANLTDHSSVFVDGLGRPFKTTHDTPSGVATVLSTYDGLDHMVTVTNPYFSTSDPTYGLIQNQYDALGRVTQTTKQDGSISTISYSDNCTTITDEAGKQRRSCTDAAGRLTNVLEDPSGLNYETDYQYDVLGNLLRVDQKGSAPADSSQWRTRLFTYDSLSRLLIANNPESGLITYFYDANGNLTQKVMPSPNQTGTAQHTISYCYDALNRVTGKAYSWQNCQNGLLPSGTAAVTFTYDTYAGKTLGSSIGRLVRTGGPSTGGHYFTYDALGRVTSTWQCLPSDCANGASVNAQYNLAGDLTKLTYPDSRVVNYSYNGANQLNNVQYTQWNGAAVTPYSYWSVADSNFYANGAPKAANFGNGITESYQFNSRLQPLEDTVSNVLSGSTVTFADHVYNYTNQTVTGNNGNILSVADQLNALRTQSFGYDLLNRLTSATEGRWGLSFTYDPWGNFLKQTVTAGSANAHSHLANASNQFTDMTYDAAGNTQNDGFHSYVYDPENRITQGDGSGATYTYDGDGNRLRKDVGGNFTEYVYFGSNIIAEKNQAGAWTDYIFAGGKRVAKTDTRLNLLRTQGTCVTLSNCRSQFWFKGNDLAGYKIKAGDKLFIAQYATSTAPAAGPGLNYTDAAGTLHYGDLITNIFDQDGCPMNQDCASFGGSAWHFRRMDLTPLAGMTLTGETFVETASTATANTSWTVYYGGYVLVGADGTVHPIFTGSPDGQTLSVSTWNQPGATGVSDSPYNDSCGGACVGWLTTYYHGDQIGSSRLVTWGWGWPIWQGTYLPYGEEYNAQPSSNHYKFTGKERDAESGADYFGARYYGSNFGRFLTPDWSAGPTAVPYAELGDPQSLNLYSYVRNSPIVRFDVDGHFTAPLAEDKAPPSQPGATVSHYNSDTSIRTNRNVYINKLGGVKIVTTQTVNQVSTDSHGHHHLSTIETTTVAVYYEGRLTDNGQSTRSTLDGKTVGEIPEHHIDAATAAKVSDAGNIIPNMRVSSVAGFLNQTDEDMDAHPWVYVGAGAGLAGVMAGGEGFGLLGIISDKAATTLDGTGVPFPKPKEGWAPTLSNPVNRPIFR